MPVIFLTAHSIELALKAILKSKGFSAERLSKKPLGHNISKLAEEVCAIEGEDVCSMVMIWNYLRSLLTSTPPLS